MFVSGSMDEDRIGSICAQAYRNKFICRKGRVLTCMRRRNVECKFM